MINNQSKDEKLLANAHRIMSNPDFILQTKRIKLLGENGKNPFNTFHNFHEFQKEYGKAPHTKTIKYNNLETYPHLLLVFSPIKEVSTILKKYCIKGIYDIKKHVSYYVVALPENQDNKRRFKEDLMSLGVQNERYFTIDYTSKFTLFYTKNPLKLHWNERRYYMINELQNLNHFSYNYKEDPTFPLFVGTLKKDTDINGETYFELDENTLNSLSFINKYDKGLSAKDIYIKALKSHLLFSTQIFKQNRIQHLKFAPEDLKKFDTQRYKLKEDTNFKDFIYFTPEELQNYKQEYNNLQRIEVPLKLIQTCFAQQHLGIKGLRFLLLFLFSYHSKIHVFHYKPSTIVERCKLRRAKGTKYVANQLNKYFTYLHAINLIPEPIEVTPEDIKNDKAIKIYTKPLKEVKL